MLPCTASILGGVAADAVADAVGDEGDDGDDDSDDENATEVETGDGEPDDALIEMGSVGLGLALALGFGTAGKTLPLL